MATQAQTTANRQNSKKSTGPRTAEGKTAVSQNAVKHGLFAHEAIIHGESQADFELHREAFLAEWRPAGMTESMLAERIVSLSWRLHRAERMESQAIDDLIICAADSTEITRSMLGPETRQALADAGTLDRDVSLGQAVTQDFASYRILDRLMLYERRMENSLHKTIRLLKKLQLMRIIEQADAAEQKSAQESPPAQRRRSDLKKQSQFARGSMGATPFTGNDYDDIPPAALPENKPNKSVLSVLEGANLDDAASPARPTLRQSCHGRV